MAIFKLFYYSALVLIGLSALVFLAGQLGFLRGTPRATLGVAQGRLAPPSSTPNSVSSQAGLYPDHPQADYAAIEPLRPASGEPGLAAMKRLAAVVAAAPGVVITEQTNAYLRAEATTPTLKFVDDLEFWLDEAAGVIHLRSASRLGRKDFGANRTRLEALRTAFTAQKPGT